ncbi:glutamate--tRNA ligase [Hyphobacterium sp. CCMP332]|nr:glutamate--tRNA ligase [Hyphobacterium sp. CCMP332]
MTMSVRVRFAPSPTGPLHIGGVRTALFNFLFAKNQGGTFVLRIEDTDQTRFVPGAEAYIMESLEWLGISPDESPLNPGKYEPYRQSERKNMYKQYADRLIENGNAYYAFDTPQELDVMRERLKAARVPNPQYNSVTRESMKNSLTLPEDEVKKRLNSGEPYVVRIKVPRKEEVRLNDLVRGWVMVESETIDDKVILKSDGMPTYHLANVVDDHFMKITHVIRGEEWLPSAPLHVLLYKYLGWESEMPEFAHLPLILKPDGNGKLSKRDGDKLGFPVFPLNWTDPETGEKSTGFRERGFLPETMNNFLAMLGWSPGNNEEFFSMDDLIEKFSISRIGKAGTKFDIEKAKWFNQHYLREKSNSELSQFLIEDLKKEGLEYNEEKLNDIIELVKERLVFPSDLFDESRTCFERPVNYDPKVVEKKWDMDAKRAIKQFVENLENLNDFKADKIKQLYYNTTAELGIKMGKVMPALRLAVTGEGMGPDLMILLEILGKKELIARLNLAIEKIG